MLNRVELLLQIVRGTAVGKPSRTALREGLEERPSSVDEQYHRTIIKRLIAAYNRAKEAQPRQPAAYWPGGEWAGHLEHDLALHIKALRSGDESTVAKLLRDMFRVPGIMSGIMNYGNFEDIRNGNWLRQRVFAHHILEDFATWDDLVGGDPCVLETPHVGNPYGYVVRNGVLLLPTACRHHFFASRIAGLLSDITDPVVAEIGGGFGGMAYYLLAAVSRLRYVDFDLPEVIVFASYYLLMAHPTKRVLLFGEGRVADADYDVAVMPNFCLPELRDRSMDLTVNMNSLSEMGKETVDEYVGQIARFTRRYFLHENSDTPTAKRYGHREVPASEFPIPADFKRLYKSRSVWGNAMTTRYREFLYERAAQQPTAQSI